MPREAIAEATEAEPIEPEVGLLERLATSHTVQGETEGDVVPRRLPRQEGVVLEQDGHVRRRDITLDRAPERLLQSDHRTQKARLAGPRRSHEADELTVLDSEAGAFEHRLAAIGNRQVGDAQG